MYSIDKLNRREFIGAAAGASSLLLPGRLAMAMTKQARHEVVQPGNIRRGALREGINSTRCGGYDSFVGGWDSLNSRTGHVALNDIRSLKLAEMWLRSSFVIEIFDVTATATVRAAIEYPSGVYSQITWQGGRVSGTIPTTGYLESDYGFPRTMIPKGATYWIRKWISAPSGIYCSNGSYNAALDGINVGTGLTDLTMGGAIGNAGQIWMPTAGIIGLTSTPTVIVTGDSIAAGQGDDGTISDFRQGLIAKGFPSGVFGFLNHGVGGASTQGTGSTQDYIGTTSVRQNLWKYGTHFISGLGNNDLYIDGRTAATTLSNLQTRVWSKFPPRARVLQMTITPRSTSSDLWRTGAPNQVTNAGNATRVTFNGLIRAGGIVGMHGFLETAWAAEDAHDSGLWNYDGVTANLYTSDGTHGSPTGYATVAAAVYNANLYSTQ